MTRTRGRPRNGESRRSDGLTGQDTIVILFREAVQPLSAQYFNVGFDSKTLQQKLPQKGQDQRSDDASSSSLSYSASDTSQCLQNHADSIG